MMIPLRRGDTKGFPVPGVPQNGLKNGTNRTYTTDGTYRAHPSYRSYSSDHSAPKLALPDREGVAIIPGNFGAGTGAARLSGKKGRPRVSTTVRQLADLVQGQV